jgi:hypothetical protein
VAELFFLATPTAMTRVTTTKTAKMVKFSEGVPTTAAAASVPVAVGPVTA